MLLLLLAMAIAAPAAATSSIGRTLVALERDIDAATAHAVALRDRFAADVATGEGAAIVGIADGGAGSSLTALGLAARAVDRRLEWLRLATADGLAAEQAELVLALRSSLAILHRTIEAMSSIVLCRAGRERRLAVLDETLAELDQAAAALASFDWSER